MRHITARNKKIIFTAVLILTATLFTGCSKNTSQETTDSKKQEYITASDFLLDTNVTINLYDKQDETILNGCFDLIKKYENIYSRTKETSELYALNHRTAPIKDGAYQISDELADILKYGLYYCELSEGAFDISIEPASSLWEFTSSTPTVPSDTDITAALPYINYKYIHLKGNSITFDKDRVGIDLGAIAKGYIADRIKDYLLANGVKSAMINLGGNVLSVGEKPDGSPFHVGIQKPFADRNETVAVMDISDLSVVSSGVYERYFEANGKLYHHILNPKTGYPYDNELISVTIISKKSTDGDGLSTTCFALGLEKGLDLIASLPDTYAVFITSDYKIYYSKGFKDAIKITEQ
ncbi:MAG TPA: FAD:protein FMN transferase [Mobilitalea sp.]|nr:FAD:protein FMN transferase [Mobilitalea sp.]